MTQRVGRRAGSRRRRVGEPISLAVTPSVRLRVSPAGFWRLCVANPDLRLERSASGEVIITPPAGSDSGRRNAALGGQLWLWNERTHLGVAFDSSAGFTLPNSAVRAPDATWMTRERWHALPEKDQKRFSHVVPNFVAELRSPSDELQDQRAKMIEYLEQGVRFGWLIDPETQTVEIYRPGRPIEVLQRPASLSGEDVLPGFVLQLDAILFD